MIVLVALGLHAIAAAAPLRIAAPPGATVEVLPSVEPGRVEILVHGGDRELQSLFRGAPADGVRTGRITDLGGHQVVTVWMQSPTDTLALLRVEEGWEGVAVPLSKAPTHSSRASPVECAGTPGTPLVPLRGADMVQDYPADTFVLTSPRWEAAEPSAVSWARVTALRAELFGREERAEPDPRALYELGAQHRELGHLREAVYYFDSAATAGAPGGLAQIQRAGALLTLHAWSDARGAAEVAAKAGAPDHAALTVLATVSMLTGDPLPVSTGRALAQSLAAPEPSLLAGALLLRAGCWTEAAPVLERALPMDGERGALARLLLADARLLAGDIDGADTVLGDLPADGAPAQWKGLARARTRLLALVRQSPNLWPAQVPTLERLAASPGRSSADVRSGDDVEAAEALFLLGQIGDRLGNDDLALGALGSLIQLRRGLLAGEPGARLLAVWTRRVTGLLDDERDIDALATHLAAWRPGLTVHMTDPAPLAAVAAAYVRVGLYDEALDTLGVVAEVEGRRALDDRGTILSVAEIYRRIGRPTQALDALDFLATRRADPAIVVNAAILRGRVLLDQGDVEGARAVWSAVIAPPAAAVEARLRIALVDAEAGRCGGVDLLSSAALPADLAPGRVAISRAACLATAVRFDESRTIAAQVVGQLTDPSTTAWAEVLAGTPPEGMWRRIAADDAAQVALRARLAGYPLSNGGT